MQHSRFDSLDGLDLGALPAAFAHDGFELGGSRNDVVTTVNALDLRLTQYVGVLSFGLTDWVDLSVSVPLVSADLTIASVATLRRLGTSETPDVHFFEGQAGEHGIGRTFVGGGRATGIGDITVRVKGAAVDIGSSRVALGVDTRLPTGDEENLLGSGALGVRPFVVWSLTNETISPHANASYQWNGSSTLSGNVATGSSEDFPDEFAYAVGTAVAITRQSNVTLDILGRHVLNGLRLAPQDFVASTGDRFADIRFMTGSFNMMAAAVGFSVRANEATAAYASVLFALNDSGLRSKVIPMVGLQHGF